VTKGVGNVLAAELEACASVLEEPAILVSAVRKEKLLRRWPQRGDDGADEMEDDGVANDYPLIAARLCLAQANSHGRSSGGDARVSDVRDVATTEIKKFADAEEAVEGKESGDCSAQLIVDDKIEGDGESEFESEGRVGAGRCEFVPPAE